ncbi:MAG: hypothetical protein Q9191_006138, partial [Dirinaria sp. TL-2023a]
STLGASLNPDPDVEEGEHEESPTRFLERKLSALTSAYEGRSLRDRYASHNDYIGFRKLVHDAQNPGEEAPPMPHASTWFPSSSSPSSQLAANANSKNRKPSAAADEDSDEDVQIASERRSIRCPLTLLPMQEPVRSTKCPHAFEKSAILDMLSHSEMFISSSSSSEPSQMQTQTQMGRGNRGRGEQKKAMACPECRVLLTEDTLVPDAALVRQIRRIQARQQQRARADDFEDEEEESQIQLEERRKKRMKTTGSQAQNVDLRIKREIMSGRGRVEEREVSMVPGTQLQGQGGEDEGGEEVVGETQFSAEAEDDEGDEGEEPSGATADVLSLDEEDEE